MQKAVPTARKQIFIVDADDSDGEDHEDCEDDMDFDRVCSFCDDGGMLLCCDGRCMRSFHATKEDGIATNCESLGLTDVHVKAMTSFQCQNCKSQRHQCFACGLLGSSDVASGAEVFPCISATCGHFYHPVCVAKLIHPEDATKAAVLQNQIATGESFTCPAHRCSACKKLEDKTFHELQFAICRRCPTSYHRKCMPKSISFECTSFFPTRAWDGLLNNRVLIYCLKHKVNPELKTPERNHILFSDTQRSGMKNTSQLSGRMKNIGDSKKILLQKIGSKMSKPVDLTSKNVERGFSQACSGASKSLNISVAKHPSNYSGILPKEQWSGSDARGCLSASSALVEELLRRNSEPRHKQGTDTGKIRIKNTEMMRKSSSWSNSAAMEERMAAFKKKCDASFDEKKFRSKMSVVSTHSSNPRNMLDKAITQGRMDASVKAVREALRKLEEGGTLEEAKAICEPRILNQIVTWQRKLRVYLAPFLHGMRYTSYGRHFTKFEKLQEVVHRLHHYVLDGDTIVDFCCGSNDFSLLMKKKLNEMGKCCSFRNYDIIQPKNDFCFEKRDWMSVTPKELPTGSKLIMGLNPPFGVKASLANKFINKALEFNPKLIILIVPEETKRLDDNYAYDLIWEDRKILSGKSFYLPGSIDVHNKQIEQWNNSPPPLYLWSRSDWSNNHRNIATKHGHLFMMQGEANVQHDSGVPTTISNYLMEESNDCYGDFSDVMPVDITKILDDISDPEYSNESEPDEVCENKRKYNNSSEDTELSGGESSLLVKKRVNHPFYEASSSNPSDKSLCKEESILTEFQTKSKLSSAITKPEMIRTTQGLMNWSQPVPAGSSSGSKVEVNKLEFGGGSQISSVGAAVEGTNIHTTFNYASANEVTYPYSSGHVNWQTNFEVQPYAYAPAPMQQNYSYGTLPHGNYMNYHQASFPQVPYEQYVPQYMPSGYVNPYAIGSSPYFQSAHTDDNLPPIPGLGTAPRPYPGP
ncbi:unnamed protein product [Rhodiola kirilowii]